LKKLIILLIVLIFCTVVITGCSASSANAAPTWKSQKTQKQLVDVWGTSSSDVFAVGGAGTILHYNGKSWTAMKGGTTNDLNGIWGSSSTDVFAVGGAGTILHYDGKLWSTMSSGVTTGIAVSGELLHPMFSSPVPTVLSCITMVIPGAL
jgi:hypothetical protein